VSATRTSLPVTAIAQFAAMLLAPAASAAATPLLGAHGQARITGGTGELAGAKGSFRIACEPAAPCTYHGQLHR
jgi:hypothetical protein